MELSFSKQAKLETLDNFKYPKTECCKQNFLKGYFYDVKFDDFTDIVVHPDIIKSTKEKRTRKKERRGQGRRSKGTNEKSKKERYGPPKT